MMEFEANKIPEVFEKEREESLSQRPMPELITIKISKQLATLLQCRSQLNDRDPEWFARQILELWAEHEIAGVELFQKMLAEKGETLESFGKKLNGDVSDRAVRRSEHELRNNLAEELRNLGFIVATEVNTGAGNADIVLHRTPGGPPIAVIEVKIEIRSWREGHQATGQATAYAKAMKCKQWFVAAAEVDQRLLKDRVFLLADAAASINTALGGEAA